MRLALALSLCLNALVLVRYFQVFYALRVERIRRKIAEDGLAFFQGANQ